MGVIRIAKSAIKAVTSPQMRAGIIRAAFLSYIKFFFSYAHDSKLRFPFGVNLVGHIRGDYGLGESCRLVAGGLSESGVPFCIVNISQNGGAAENNMDWETVEQTKYRYGINLIHLNPPELFKAVWRVPPVMLRNGYNIAYWLWELPEFPPEWDAAFRLFDEIWTPAEYVSEAIRKRTNKPVLTMPYGLTVPKKDCRFDRAYFGLPEDRFLYLVSYDGNSVSERKNPEGAVGAFRRAFTIENKNVGLVIKATHEKDERLDKMLAQLNGYSVTVLTESYSKVQFNSLLACINAYVSLHRAEGFGLVMAEAMMLGTPVIATNWSANTEFMNKDTGCIVDVEIVPLNTDYPPYHKGDHWAQPNEGQAAMWMRKLYEDAAFRERLVQNAKIQLEAKFSPQHAGKRMKARLEELRNERYGNADTP